jgi:hypothetical protein
MTTEQTGSADAAFDLRPARAVLIEMLNVLDSSCVSDAEQADRVYNIGERWLSDNPEDPPEPTPIDPGEGWDLLPDGTVVEDGDDASNNGIAWGKTWSPGRRVGDAGMANFYRRRKPVAQWPKYYVDKDPKSNWSGTAYVRRDSDRVFVDVGIDGGKCQQSWDTDLRLKFVREGQWLEVTKAEALARVKPTTTDRTPVESPDDWVRQDQVLARLEMDVVWWGDNPPADKNQWCIVSSEGLAVGKMHGYYTASDGDKLNVACRRKDLPASPKQLPVSLWVPQRIRAEAASWAVRCTPAGVVYTDGGRSTWIEIKIGQNGFYVEE